LHATDHHEAPYTSLIALLRVIDIGTSEWCRTDWGRSQ